MTEQEIKREIRDANMTIATQEQFNRFMHKAEQQEYWNDTEAEEWESACEYAGINYHDYDDPDMMWNDLCKAWEQKRTYTMKDAEREIEQAIKLGEGGIYSFINDLRRGGDITKEEALELMCKYVNGIPTF